MSCTAICVKTASNTDALRSEAYAVKRGFVVKHIYIAHRVFSSTQSLLYTTNLQRQKCFEGRKHFLLT